MFTRSQTPVSTRSQIPVSTRIQSLGTYERTQTERRRSMTVSKGVTKVFFWSMSQAPLLSRSQTPAAIVRQRLSAQKLADDITWESASYTLRSHAPVTSSHVALLMSTVCFKTGLAFLCRTVDQRDHMYLHA